MGEDEEKKKKKEGGLFVCDREGMGLVEING
jgi:hypothetical protein